LRAGDDIGNLKGTGSVDGAGDAEPAGGGDWRRGRVTRTTDLRCGRDSRNGSARGIERWNYSGRLTSGLGGGVRRERERDHCGESDDGTRQSPAASHDIPLPTQLGCPIPTRERSGNNPTCGASAVASCGYTRVSMSPARGGESPMSAGVGVFTSKCKLDDGDKLKSLRE
jgi:hypothetical protein